MTLATTAAVAAIAGTAYGAYQGDRAADRASDAQRDALAASRTRFSPFTFSGPGGQLAQYDSGGMSLVLGDNQYNFEQLRRFAEGGVQGLGRGLPMDISAAMGDVVRRMGGPSLELGGAFRGIERMNQGVGDASYNELLRMMGGGFQRPLQNTSFAGAARQLQDAQMGGMDAAANRLSLLRQQAQPFEQRGMEDLQQRLFNMGQMGTTGGGMQMEAFARGLGQADLSRQLEAAEEGRRFQNNALGLASGMSGMGLALNQNEQNLLANAFGRFRDTQGLAFDLNRERFSRSMYGNELGFGRARDILGLRTNLAMLPGQLDAQRLGNISGALGARQGLQDSVLQLFSAGLSAEQAAANARIGAGSNMAAIAGSPSFGQADMARAGMWSNLGASMMGEGGMAGALQTLFAPRVREVGTSPRMMLDYIDMNSLPQRI